jgi:hypothetical protein
MKFKKFLNHDFAAAQPLFKSSGDQVNGTIDSCFLTASALPVTHGKS